MTTGNFADWTGKISEIGAIYPFVGTEGLLVAAGFVFWIWWHIAQAGIEKNESDESIANKDSS